MSDQSFPKKNRLLSPFDFERVYGSQAYVSDGVLVLNGSQNALNVTRLGLSVSRKVGNAVVRNRWKRLIREAFRHGHAEMPTGLDLVVRPKRGALPVLTAIQQSLPALVKRLAKRLSSQR
jgi:ribonuclease P protein component